MTVDGWEHGGTVPPGWMTPGTKWVRDDGEIFKVEAGGRWFRLDVDGWHPCEYPGRNE